MKNRLSNNHLAIKNDNVTHSSYVIFPAYF